MEGIIFEIFSPLGHINKFCVLLFLFYFYHYRSMSLFDHCTFAPPLHLGEGVFWPLRIGQHRLKSGESLQFQSHWNSVTWITQGALLVQSEPGSRTLGIHEGFFARSGSSWRIAADDKNVSFRSLDWIGSLPGTPPSVFTEARDPLELEASFDQLWNKHREKRAATPLQIFSLAGACLAAIVESNPRKTARPHTPQALVQAARHYAEAHLDSGIGVEGLAKFCGIGVSTLRRAFFEVTGHSAGTMLAEMQMIRARSMLGSSDFPLKVVASQCGFRTEQSFSRRFAQYHGVAPGAWRKATAQGLSNKKTVDI
jgi:AraC-like DNA-binding protein